MDWVSKPHTHCRVCGTELKTPYLDLGQQPLANALIDPATLRPEAGEGVELRFPLQVILCEQCGLSQLSVVVNPEILYAGYRFRSGQSEAWVRHCEELAKRCTKEWDRFPLGKVLDIAANDGTQLIAFMNRGWFGYGIDPSPALPQISRGFWSEEFARETFSPGSIDLVIAQNVLGHVDDPISFLKAIKTVLAPEGRVVIEVPDMYELIDATAFDTVYHEHLSYWSEHPIKYAASLAGLAWGWDTTEHLDLHGGSRRYWFRHATESDGRLNLPNLFPPRVDAFAQRVGERLRQDCFLLADLDDKKILGWGASAKAAVYLNALAKQTSVMDISPLRAIIDDCAEKQGMLLPGVHIPIIACPESLEDVDIIHVLSWNNFDSIANKARSRHFTGKFLVTHPEPRLIDA